MLVGPAIFPLVAFSLVILPSMVIFVMPVMLVSGVFIFCAFTEFRPGPNPTKIKISDHTT